MKYSYYAIIALCLFLVVQVSIAQERKFGLGVTIGEPTGISAKLWTSNYTAFDFGLGWSNGRNIVHFHTDYLWHSFEAIHSTERFPLYYGVGGRINSAAGYNSSLAIRGVLGIAWLPRGTPIDVFIELAPSLQLTSSTGFVLDAGIGARYFF
jgi:hypothetical protein